jgi:DNA invertase Pin-like site-specific DNA recombinase
MKGIADFSWIVLACTGCVAWRGGFEVLLTCGPDRLARDSALHALIMEELERWGVRIIFLKGGTAEERPWKLAPQTTGTMTEIERAQVKER